MPFPSEQHAATLPAQPDAQVQPLSNSQLQPRPHMPVLSECVEEMTCGLPSHCVPNHQPQPDRDSQTQYEQQQQS